MAYSFVKTLVPSAAYTASGTSASQNASGDPGEYTNVLVSVTAVSGTTPTLDLALQWSHDGVVWAGADTPDSFTQITAVKATVKTFQTKGPFYRLVYTVGGTTPSFTFSVTEFVTE